MSRLHDSIYYCPNCRSENFYDNLTDPNQSRDTACWNCNKSLNPPLRLEIERQTIILNNDTHIYPHHITNNRDVDFSQSLAKVVQHPSDERIWGLKNISSQKWVMTNPGGTTKEVAPGKSVTLDKGVKIDFGGSEGKITY